MQTLFDTLPGIKMRLSEVNEALNHMWEGQRDESGNLQDVHAVQMNLILHFGLKTSEPHGLACFGTVVRFAQKYPCRIIVLCPQETRREKELLMAKLFSQCYIGGNHRERCCCEAVIISYSPSDSEFVEHQLSLFEEADLPVYHWFDGVPTEVIKASYLPLVKRTRRVVYDSSIEQEDLMKVSWPNPEKVKDLSEARTLPSRQSIGQFLSGFSAEELASGLRTVIQRYTEPFSGEAENLIRWQRERIARCLEEIGGDVSQVRFATELTEDFSSYSLQSIWGYADQQKMLRWSRHASSQTGTVRARFGRELISRTLQIRTLRPEEALAEALFF